MYVQTQNLCCLLPTNTRGVYVRKGEFWQNLFLYLCVRVTWRPVFARQYLQVLKRLFYLVLVLTFVKRMNDLHNTLSISGLERGVYNVVITVYTRYVRVCMCVYVCMYVCTYIYMYTHVSQYIHAQFRHALKRDRWPLPANITPWPAPPNVTQRAAMGRHLLFAA